MQQKYLFLCRETCRHVLYDGYIIVVQYIFLSPLYLLPNQSWLVLNQVLVIKRKQLIPSYLKQNRPVFLGKYFLIAKHHNNCHESFFLPGNFQKVSYHMYCMQQNQNQLVVAKLYVEHTTIYDLYTLLNNRLTKIFFWWFSSLIGWWRSMRHCSFSFDVLRFDSACHRLASYQKVNMIGPIYFVILN